MMKDVGMEGWRTLDGKMFDSTIIDERGCDLFFLFFVISHLVISHWLLLIFRYLHAFFCRPERSAAQ
jgi:hypothetical protein